MVDDAIKLHIVSSSLVQRSITAIAFAKLNIGNSAWKVTRAH